ncbi:MAG: HEAT repeat domain-containing protein [Bryobacteraceae bacterium]|jgi:hypothetical protein
MLVVALALPCQADAGVPMLALMWPGMFLALVPVVLLEAWVLKARLRLDTRLTLKLSLLTNLASTVAGIPIAWVAMLGLELLASLGADQMALNCSAPLQQFVCVAISAAWLNPVESEFYWMIPTATLALLPACFLVSYFIEYRVTEFLIRRMESRVKIRSSDAAGSPVRGATFSANLASYASLMLITAIWLGVSLTREGSTSHAYDLYNRRDRLQHVAGAAALAQKGLLDERGVDDLIAIVNSGPAGPELEPAIIALGKGGFTRAAPVLVQLLGSQPSDYWRDADICDALARLRYTDAIPTLESCLRSKEFGALPNAFRALITLGDRDAVPLAIARIEPQIEGLNDGFVVKELEKVTGQQLGFNRQSWMNWWNSAQSNWTIPPAFRKPYDKQPGYY